MHHILPRATVQELLKLALAQLAPSRQGVMKEGVVLFAVAQNAPVSPARFARAENAAESYRRVEGEIVALASEDVGRVTADVPLACSVALGAPGERREAAA